MVSDGYKQGNYAPLVLINKSPKRHINKIKIAAVIIILLVIAVMFFIFKKPTVKVNGDKVEKVQYKSEFIDRGITVKYHGVDITNKVVKSGNVDTSKLGEYQIIYKIPYWFGEYNYKRKVKVVDELPPELKLNGDLELDVSYDKEYEEQGYKATDNYDGDLTDKVEVSTKDISESEKEICYKAVDSSGNHAEAKRKINIVDKVKPNIEINGEGTLFLNLGDEYQEQGARAEDEKDGELTDRIEISGGVDTNAEGTYMVTYSATDNSGNQAVATRTIVVGAVGRAAMNVGNPGTVYLTFDDGPTTTITPQILDILKEKGVKATFFVIDYGQNTEYLIKRIVDEGHAIAIHGGSHDYAAVYSSAATYLDGLDYMKEKIKNTTGIETNIIRFPGGSSNTISRKYCQGVMTVLVNETLKRGYRYFDWNVMSGDSGDAKLGIEVYDNVTKGLKPTRSNIVLMHDFASNAKTVEALPGIIDFAKENGYLFEKITDKTPMITQNVQN